MSSFGGEIGPPPLSGEHRIAAWAPGTEIRFEKPLSFAFFVRLPLTLMVFAGPAMWIAMGRRHLAQPDPKGQIWLSAVVGLIGLWLGLSNLSDARRARRETVAFHWPSGLLRVSGRRSVEIPLAAITAIEVQGITERRIARGDGDMSSTPYYKCLLQAHYGASPTTPTRTLDLVETEFAADDPAAPMRQASTVAAELAAALGVQHHVTDYPPLPPR